MRTPVGASSRAAGWPSLPAKVTRAALPAHLPRREVPRARKHRVPCGFSSSVGKRSGAADYKRILRVERHVRGKWCAALRGTLYRDSHRRRSSTKGIPSAGLLAHVLISRSSPPHTTLSPGGIWSVPGCVGSRSNARRGGVCRGSSSPRGGDGSFSSAPAAADETQCHAQARPRPRIEPHPGATAHQSTHRAVIL